MSQQRTDIIRLEAATAAGTNGCLVWSLTLTSRGGNVSAILYDNEGLDDADVVNRKLTLVAPNNETNVWAPGAPAELTNGAFVSLSSGAVATITLQKKT